MSLLPKKALRTPDVSPPGKRRGGRRLEGDPNQPFEAGGPAQPPARSFLLPGDATPNQTPEPGFQPTAPSCALRRGSHPKTLGAARGRRRPRQRVRERDDPSAHGPRGPPGGAAARPRLPRRRRYLVLGRRVWLADRPLSQLGHAWRPRRDVAGGEQRSRRSGQLRAGARGLHSAGPAPPELLSGPTTARQQEVELGPAQRRRRPFTRAEHSRPATVRPARSTREERPGASAHAHRRHHGRRDPPMARIHQVGGVVGAGRSGTGKLALD